MVSADSAFADLANNPGLGAEIGSRNLKLIQLRKWHIDGFPRMIVFYAPAPRALRIVRVLNSAQDWWAALDIG